MTHYLKTWPEYFNSIKLGIKKFEVRKNDRNFQTKDILILEEFNPSTGEYTGDKLQVIVNYILIGGEFGIEDGYVVMSINF